MNADAFQPGKLIRFIAGWLVLALYLGVSAPVGATMTVGLASMDWSHQVRVEAEANGVSVILHHRQCGSLHRHGIVARAISFFSHPASPTNSDHVLQFGAPDAYSATAPPKIALEASANPASVDLILEETAASLRLADFLAAVPTHAPPIDGGLSFILRSTVLLI